MVQSRNMKEFLRAVWRWVRWPVLVLGFLYAVLVGFRTVMLFDEDKTNAAVAEIHAQKITLADVMGTGLPPAPDKAENDATVAGIDKNNNGIRDDVELAIFKKYPNDKKTRAAALQYAMAEQMYLTRVYNTETWKAVAEEGGRANLCLSFASDATYEYIENLVFNTEIRKAAQEKVFEFITSHGTAEGNLCDVSI